MPLKARMKKNCMRVYMTMDAVLRRKRALWGVGERLIEVALKGLKRTCAVEGEVVLSVWRAVRPFVRRYMALAVSLRIRRLE